MFSPNVLKFSLYTINCSVVYVILCLIEDIKYNYLYGKRKHIHEIKYNASKIHKCKISFLDYI